MSPLFLTTLLLSSMVSAMEQAVCSHKAYVEGDCGQGDFSSKHRHAEVKTPKAISLLQTNNVNMPGIFSKATDYFSRNSADGNGQDQIPSRGTWESVPAQQEAAQLAAQQQALTQNVAAQVPTAASSGAQAPATSAAKVAGPVAQIAPFGKEDTAGELQKHAARTQDTLIDAVENAEVAEIKRAVFRSLTRLRAAEIKEFDTIARLETQAIDEYNDNHHYRAENPLDYIHSSEPKVAEDKYTSFHG